eukprot:5446114-Lingulodinium_polyedra.AAC.1
MKKRRRKPRTKTQKRPQKMYLRRTLSLPAQPHRERRQAAQRTSATGCTAMALMARACDRSNMAHSQIATLCGPQCSAVYPRCL